MVILSLLGVGVWAGVTAALRAVARSHDAALSNARLLQLDDRFRGATARIRPPWWAAALDVKESEDTWRVPFLDGVQDKVLIVTFRDGVLSIDDNDYVSLFPGFTSASLTVTRDKNETAYALTLEVDGKDFGHVSFIAQLGGFPVRQQAGQ
jgi:hypothetical protein